MKAKFDQQALKREEHERNQKRETQNKKREKLKEKSNSGKVKISNYIFSELRLMIPEYIKPPSDKIIPIKIEDIEEPSIETFFLCSGATLKCNQGDASSTYSVLPDKKVFLNDKPLAVISDTKPVINIKSFGQCKSMANPDVASATAANNGRLQKMPCKPNTVGIWSEGISYFLAAGEKVPCEKSKLNCAYAGEISISDVGQNTVGGSKGSSSSDDKEDETEEEKKKKEEFKEIESVIYTKRKSYKKEEEEEEE